MYLRLTSSVTAKLIVMIITPLQWALLLRSAQESQVIIRPLLRLLLHLISSDSVSMMICSAGLEKQIQRH